MQSAPDSAIIVPAKPIIVTLQVQNFLVDGRIANACPALAGHLVKSFPAQRNARCRLASYTLPREVIPLKAITLVMTDGSAWPISAQHVNQSMLQQRRPPA